MFQAYRHYANGTVRHGPLHQISLVGTVHEEVGGFFPDLLARLEANPFLKEVSCTILLSGNDKTCLPQTLSWTHVSFIQTLITILTRLQPNYLFINPLILKLQNFTKHTLSCLTTVYFSLMFS